MNTKIVCFIKNEDGQGLVEYSLILILVGIAVVSALGIFGSSVEQLYQKAVNEISAF
jgi:Flp pilus assembly pilin Flp